MLLISCAALIATPVTPHRLILAADVDHSLPLRMAQAVGDRIPSRGEFDPTGTVRFTSLQTDPIDSVLKKVSALFEFALNHSLCYTLSTFAACVRV
jgi:hypothetical protein